MCRTGAVSYLRPGASESPVPKGLLWIKNVQNLPVAKNHQISSERRTLVVGHGRVGIIRQPPNGPSILSNLDLLEVRLPLQLGYMHVGARIRHKVQSSIGINLR